MSATQRAAFPAAVPNPREALATALVRVERRIRLRRALDTAATFGLVALAAAGFGLALHKTGFRADARVCVVLAVALPLLGGLLGALRPVEPLLAARLLDRSLGTPDLIASAWSFTALPEHARTPFMQACLRTAGARAPDASPALAMPIEAPRALPRAVALGCGLLLLATLDVAAPRRPPAVPHARPRLLLQQDDIDAVRQAIAPWLVEQHVDPEVREVAQQLNALLEALQDSRLERARALLELRGLEQRLADATQVDDERALREALRRLGVALDRDSLAQSVADAFREADTAKARAALEQLAGKLEAQTTKPATRHALGRALDRAAHQSARDDEQRLARAKNELERLLRRHAERGQDAEREQRLLRQKQRELDRLSREQERTQNAERKLDGLRRELGAAGRALGQDRGDEAAEHTQRAAEQLARAQREQTSAEQRRRLAQRVQELRELVSKQRAEQAAGVPSGKPDAQRKLSVDAFARAARGQGEPNEASKALGGTRQGATLLSPDDGREPNGSVLQQSEQTTQTGAVDRDPTHAEPVPGSGGHPELSEHATVTQNRGVDTHIRGVEGEGPTRSQVIREAGQHGFVSREYQQVHADYERHAEAVLDRDKIPGGYRFYVRRYFQLIRPRESAP